MKKLLFFAMVLCLPFAFTSCRKSNSSFSNHQQPIADNASLSDILKAGSWIIDYYYDEEDKSVDLTGYVFTFNADGGLTLKKGNESYTGQWQALKEEGISKLSININTINLIQKLNDKWQLKTINSTKLEMRNDIAARSEFLNLKRI